MALYAADDDTLARCVEALERGEPIVIPTDTVYGLAARANDAEAVGRLFALKQRPADLSIAALVADLEQAELHAQMGGSASLAHRYWPGPLTLIVDRLPDSDLAVGDPVRNTVGLRAPAHPFVRRLAKTVGPLAATSANRSGTPTPSTPDAIADVFPEVELVVDGGVLDGLASTVALIDGTDINVLREGALSRADLLAALD